jgi:hypothetical protein
VAQIVPNGTWCQGIEQFSYHVVLQQQRRTVALSGEPIDKC